MTSLSPMRAAAATILGSMLAAENLYRDLLDFENEALVIVSESKTILFAPRETRNKLQRGEMKLQVRELSDRSLAAKYDAGTEKRQAYLLESSTEGDFDQWAPLLWDQLKASGIDGILVLYDSQA